MTWPVVAAGSGAVVAGVMWRCSAGAHTRNRVAAAAGGKGSACVGADGSSGGAVGVVVRVQRRDAGALQRLIAGGAWVVM